VGVSSQGDSSNLPAPASGRTALARPLSMATARCRRMAGALSGKAVRSAVWRSTPQRPPSRKAARPCACGVHDDRRAEVRPEVVMRQISPTRRPHRLWSPGRARRRCRNRRRSRDAGVDIDVGGPSLQDGGRQRLRPQIGQIEIASSTVRNSSRSACGIGFEAARALLHCGDLKNLPRLQKDCSVKPSGGLEEAAAPTAVRARDRSVAIVLR